MAIQIAIYMGFKEIYLLGIDSFKKEEKGIFHFYDESLSVFDSPIFSYLREIDIIGVMCMLKQTKT